MLWECQSQMCTCSLLQWELKCMGQPIWYRLGKEPVYYSETPHLSPIKIKSLPVFGFLIVMSFVSPSLQFAEIFFVWPKVSRTAVKSSKDGCIQHLSESSFSCKYLYDYSYICQLWDNVMISLWSKILKKQGMADLCTAPLHGIILPVNSQLIAVWPLSVSPSSNR